MKQSGVQGSLLSMMDDVAYRDACSLYDGFTFSELSACAAREVTQRQRVYNRLVEQGRMTRDFADKEIAKMDAIRRFLSDIVIAADKEIRRK